MFDPYIHNGTKGKDVTAAGMDNFLDYVPGYNTRNTWSENKARRIVVRVHNTGFFNRVAQMFFKRPEYSLIELDEFGSFVWRQMDGERNVYEIGVNVKEHFGMTAEPLYERLSQFIRILHRNAYIVYVNKMKKK